MTNPKLDLQQLAAENQLPKEALHVLKVLEELENFTAELRKKVMAELKTTNNLVNLKLEDM